MFELIGLGATGLVFVALFVALRGRAYPVESFPELVDADGAAAQAATAVRRLCGLDVHAWPHFAVLHVDDVVDRLHQLGRAEQQREFLARWGLQASWRVRFIAADGSVLVGLSPRGEVILLDITGDVHDRVVAAAGAKASAGDPDARHDDLRRRLGRPGGAWENARPVGAGYRRRHDESTQRSERFRAVGPDLRVDLEVDTVGDAVVRIDSAVQLTSDELPSLERAEQRETLAGAGALLGSVLALVGGVAVLAFAGGDAEPWLAAVLGAPVLLAVLAGERSRFRFAAVHGYEGTGTWAAFRAVNALTTVVTAATLGGVVVVAALAGSLVADRVGVPTTADLGRQLAWGAWLAAGWLGLSATGYALLNRSGLARVTPNPDRRSLRTVGLDVPHILSLTAQSAVGEEAVFRLLAVPVVFWLTGQPVLAAAVAAVLWAGTHSGGMVRPRWIRFAELTLIGLTLGLTVVHVGFVAALTAHALYNLTVLSSPLIGVRRREPRPDARADDTASPSGRLRSASAPAGA